MKRPLKYLYKFIDFFLRDKSKKSLVIVGSAPLDSDFSEIIDSCDCVVRFNNCKNYNVNSGRKTDILILTNTGNPFKQATLKFMLKKREKDEVKTELPYLHSAKYIWFIRPNLLFLRAYYKHICSKNNAFLNQELKHFDIIGQRDIIAEIINAQKIPKKRVTSITEKMYIHTWKKLISYGATDALMPSTGLLGIEMILDNPSFRNHEKYIIGFTWQGWKGHPWQLEKRLVEKYIENGVLKVLPETNDNL